MKYDLFFQLAKQAGIEDAELYLAESRSLKISLFHGEIDNYSDNNGYSILARGMINGKFGSASCDVWNKEKRQAPHSVEESVTADSRTSADSCGSVRTAVGFPQAQDD